MRLEISFRLGEATFNGWWAVDNLQVDGQLGQSTSTLFAEDFESVPLERAVEDRLLWDDVWTDSAPDGFTSEFDGPLGVTEWNGWAFADNNWWNEVVRYWGPRFTQNGSGTVMIADPGQWNEKRVPAAFDRVEITGSTFANNASDGVSASEWQVPNLKFKGNTVTDNGRRGLSVRGPGVEIGGSTIAEGNVFSGNGGVGVAIEATTPWVASLQDADDLISGAIPSETYTVSLDQADLFDGGNWTRGSSFYDNPIPGDPGEDFAFQGSGTIDVNPSGANQTALLSFALGGDDGGRLRIDGEDIIVDDTIHTFEHRIATVELTEGQHSFEWTGFNREGESGFELAVTVGQASGEVHYLRPEDGWKVLGDPNPASEVQLVGSIDLTTYQRSETSVVQGNKVADNLEHGIQVLGRNTLIGGSNAGEGNTVTGNKGDGIHIKTPGPSISTLSEVDDLILGVTPRLTTTDTIDEADLFDFSSLPNTQSQGSWTFDNPIPGGGGDNYAIVASGTIDVTSQTPLDITFALGGDDGGRLRIDGQDVVVDDSLHTFDNRTGSVSLTPGQHAIEWVGFERGGEAGFELSAFVGTPTFPVYPDQGWFLLGEPNAQLELAGPLSVTTYYSVGEDESGITVQGNLVGLDDNGLADGNSGNGILVQSGKSLIGGPDQNAGNIVSSNGMSGISIYGANQTVERNLSKENGQDGITLTQAGATLSGNHLERNQRDGIRANAPIDLRVVNNLIDDHLNGIFLAFGVGVEVINNTVTNSTDAGLFHAITPNVTVRNNIFADGKDGVYTNASSSLGPVENNLFFGNSDDDFVNFPSSFGTISTTNNNGTPADQHANIFVDPVFVRPAAEEISICTGVGYDTNGVQHLAEFDTETLQVSLYGSEVSPRMNGLILANDGTLYGSRWESDSLYQVDNTGATTTTTLIGSTGWEIVGGLAYDNVNDVIYTIGTTTGGSVFQLLMVDRTTGLATPVSGSTGTSGMTATSGLAWDHHISNRLIVFDNADNEFYSFPLTGAASKLSDAQFPAGENNSWAVEQIGHRTMLQIGDSVLGLFNPDTGELVEELTMGNGSALDAMSCSTPDVEPGDYHLQDTSPAVGAGSSINAPTEDFDGLARNAPIDIGAFEVRQVLGATVDSPANGALIGSPIAISGGATDDVGVSRVELVIYNDQLQTWDGTSFTSTYSRVNGTLGSAGSTSTSWTYDFAPSADGQYYFQATAIDGVGNAATSDWAWFNVSNDTLAPEVTVATPANGEVTDFPIAMSGEATDNASVSRVELVIYNDQLQTWDGTSFTSTYSRVIATLGNAGSTSASWTYDFAPSADGQYYLQATAIDGGGNTGNSAWTQFTAWDDSELPTIAVETPSDNHLPVNGPIEGNATDDSGVAGVQLVIYNSQLQTWNGAEFTNTYSAVSATLADTGATSTSWSYDGNLPSGAYTMGASAVDVVSKQTDRFWRTFYVGNDEAAPGISITAPDNGQTSPTSISLEGTATDDIAVREVELVIYNSQLQTWNGSAFTDSYSRVKASLSNVGGTNTNWIYDLTSVPGFYAFKATAIDAANKRTDTDWRSFNIS